MATRYFELKDTVGIEPSHVQADDGTISENPKAGELQPIVEVGIVVAVPEMIDGELVSSLGRKTVKALPDSRIVPAEHPAIADALLSSGQYVEVDPPQSELARIAKVEAARAKEEQEAAAKEAELRAKEAKAAAASASSEQTTTTEGAKS
jgi:hypothetical protein